MRPAEQGAPRCSGEEGICNVNGRIFDTRVQWLKYKVLKEVAKHAYADTLQDAYRDVPKAIIPDGAKATMRCCIYKERAVLGERVHSALGGDPENPNVIQVLDIACDECPVSGYTVGPDCRGCIAHRCEEVCPRGAITIQDQHAIIDHSKCVGCGKCASVCPYNAISKHTRPCENACKVNAIHMNEEKKAEIDNSKCISCGSCVYMCPFGAIVDRSFIVDVVKLLRASKNNQNYKVYAVVAPSVSSQFNSAKLGQVISGLKVLGFYNVIEAALGADMVSLAESRELAQRGFLTSSCCPAFVDYIKKNFPAMADKISSNLSPMGAVGKFVKATDPTAKVVFIGPCTAKKMEFQLPEVSPYVDSVLTFEELHALFEACEIDLTALEEDVLDNASYYGRIFARSGGLSDAVAEAFREQDIKDFEAKPVVCNGIEECKLALLKASRNLLPGNFIEGMACINGCIGGAGCLTHGPKDKNEVDEYGRLALEKTIESAAGIAFGVSPEKE